MRDGWGLLDGAHSSHATALVADGLRGSGGRVNERITSGEAQLLGRRRGWLFVAGVGRAFIGAEESRDSLWPMERTRLGSTSRETWRGRARGTVCDCVSCALCPVVSATEPSME